MSQAQSLLPYLPPEVIILIAQKLDMFDMISAKKVCSRWYNVIEYSPLLWQHPHFKLVWEGLFVSYVPSTCYIITRLKGCSVRSLHFTGLPNLSSLLYICFRDTFYDGHIASGFDMLYYVTRDLVIQVLWTTPESLEELIVDDWSTYALESLLRIVAMRTRVDKITVLGPLVWEEIGMLLNELQWSSKVTDFRQVNISTCRSTGLRGFKFLNTSILSENDRSGTSIHVYVEPSLEDKRSMSFASVPSHFSRFHSEGGMWVLGDTLALDTLPLEHLYLQDVWDFQLDSRVSELPLLRSLHIRYLESSPSIDVWHRLRNILKHLKAPKLEVLELCLPTGEASHTPTRGPLALQWALLVNRLPNLKELVLQPILPTSLSIIGVDPHVSQGLVKLALSGDNLPPSFLDAIRPETMPALKYLDVSGTAYSAYETSARRSEWEMAWRNAGINCYEPPRMPEFES